MAPKPESQLAQQQGVYKPQILPVLGHLSCLHPCVMCLGEARAEQQQAVMPLPERCLELVPLVFLLRSPGEPHWHIYAAWRHGRRTLS